MYISATNIARPTIVTWKGKEVQTGIFKEPTPHPLFLDLENVAMDTIADRKHHGGTYKACYLFATEEYDYWKALYPDLTWQWGMFGENLSVSGLDERELRPGDTLRIGKAKVQVTIPREPCYKLGIRFGDQGVLRQFIERERPGTYVRVLSPGQVQTGDAVTFLERGPEGLSIADLYRMLYQTHPQPEKLELLRGHPAIPVKKQEQLLRKG